MKHLTWLFIVAGIWLVVAPFVLGYADVQAAFWNDIGLGLILALAALIGLTNREK